MYRLGGIYQYGFPQLGVPVYYQQAAEWLKKAEWFKETVEQGDASVCQIPTG